MRVNIDLLSICYYVCISSICFVVKAFYQPQEVTSSISFTKRSSYRNSYCSSIRKPRKAFHRFIHYWCGNYLFSIDALSTHPSHSLMMFLIRINKQSIQHSNYMIKGSDSVPLEASRLPLHTDRALESHTAPPGSDIGPPHTRSSPWPRGPCSWAVQACRGPHTPSHTLARIRTHSRANAHPPDTLCEHR